MAADSDTEAEHPVRRFGRLCEEPAGQGGGGGQGGLRGAVGQGFLGPGQNVGSHVGHDAGNLPGTDLHTDDHVLVGVDVQHLLRPPPPLRDGVTLAQVVVLEQRRQHAGDGGRHQTQALGELGARDGSCGEHGREDLRPGLLTDKLREPDP